jgi:hypothetical protein
MSGIGHPPSHYPKLPATAWLFRAPKWQIRLLAVAAGVFVYVTSLSVDFWLYSLGATPVEFFSASDAIAALLTFAFVIKLVEHAGERRRAVIERLQLITESNHHIRNALQAIQYSAHETKHVEAIKTIDDAVDRIEWVLEEIITQPENKPPKH